MIKPDATAEAIELAQIAQDCGVAYTACLLGDPVGAAGIILRENGIGEAWSVFSPLVKTMPLGLFRAVSKGLNQIIADKKPKKVLAVVDEHDTVAIRFIEHLKFPRAGRKLMYERII